MTELTIRVSALPGYPECPRRSAALLFRSLIEAAGYKLRELPHGVGAAVGTSFHRAAEVIFKEKATSGILPPVSIATDCAVETLQEQVKEGIDFDGPRGTTRNHAEAEGQVLAIARTYHRVIGPQVNPVLVEERLEAEVAPGIILSGQPDIVAREPNAIHDAKSGARSPRSFSPQLGGYSLLVRSHAILPDVKVGVIDFMQRVRQGKPQPEPIREELDIARAETAASNIIRHIERDVRVFQHGDAEAGILPGDPWAFIANPNSILCGPRYCPAYGSDFCHEHKRSTEED